MKTRPARRQLSVKSQYLHGAIPAMLQQRLRQMLHQRHQRQMLHQRHHGLNQQQRVAGGDKKRHHGINQRQRVTEGEGKLIVLG